MFLVHQRQGNVERRPIILHRNAGFGQNGAADVHAQIFGVVWPRARVKIEKNVILAAIPVRQVVELGLHPPDIV